MSFSEKIWIYPTDTVWGVGASILNQSLHQKILSIKGNNENKPLSVLFSSVEEIRNYISLPTEVEFLLKNLCPLECTVLIPSSHIIEDRIPEFIYDSGPYIGIRCIETNEISKLIAEVGTPVTTTSLNLNGEPPIKTVEEAKLFLQKYFSDEKFYMPVGYNNSLMSGFPSTLLKMDDSGVISFLREGRFATQIKKSFENV